LDFEILGQIIPDRCIPTLDHNSGSQRLEPEFLDIDGAKVLRAFLLAVYIFYHPQGNAHLPDTLETWDRKSQI
jgi:hypothetical protein